MLVNNFKQLTMKKTLVYTTLICLAAAFTSCKKWLDLNQNNYRQYKNFHPIYNNEWDKLEFGIGKTPEEFIENFSKKDFHMNPLYIFKKNMAQIVRRALKKI